MSTTTSSDDQQRTALRARALDALTELDGNGVDFPVLGVAAHLALRIVRGEQLTAETLGEELDGDAVDALDELLGTAYFTTTGGGVLRLTEFDANGVEIDPTEAG